jgi:RNA polymerase sigma factor (sigma-70 family)
VEHRAYHELVDEHARLMSSAIRRVCSDRGLIPDIEQEVRLALWRRVQDGKGIEYPASYVYKVALTTAATLMRRNSRHGVPVDAATLEARAAGPESAAGLSAAERKLMLEQMLAELPREEERALRAYLSGFNHTEVAELFAWTESTARHRIYRTLDKLRARARESRA